MDEHNVVLEQALWWIEQHRPDASSQRKAAFANAVTMLVTGFFGHYGLSAREHAVYRQYGMRRYAFDKAVELLAKDDGLIFGSITRLHRQCFAEEYCFNDDPEDLKQLQADAATLDPRG